jgi:ABC-type uncharacterized transport system substrate-binding protein
MRRREFITLLGGVVAWPLTARAQQADRVMRIGVLMSYVESDTTAHQWTKAFSQSLQESGWIDNQNIKFEYRWAGPNPDLLQANAAELVRLRPNLLMAGATPALVALQRETRDIPIVFANVADPVGQGFRRKSGASWRQYNRIWGIRFFDGRQMGADVERDCPLDNPNCGDFQPGDGSVLPIIFVIY